MPSFAGARPPTPRPVAGAWGVLEPLDPGRHAAGLRAADRAGDDETWRWLPYGPFDADEAFRTHMRRLAADPGLTVFAVSVDGAPRGVLSFLNVVREHGTIEIGHIWLSRSLQRTTAATEAVFLLMREAFELGNRRLEWKADAGNRPSCAAAERFGFAFEGIFRQHFWVKGRNRDTAWFSLLDGEWPAVRPAFEQWLEPENFDADGRQRARLGAAKAAAAVRERAPQGTDGQQNRRLPSHPAGSRRRREPSTPAARSTTMPDDRRGFGRTADAQIAGARLPGTHTPAMGLRERLFLWRARRFVAPMVDEARRGEQRIAVGPDDWRQWWEARGKRELRCILMTAWDPIGTGETAEAWDEYDGYLAGVGHRLRDGGDDDAAPRAVAAFLNHIEHDYMGGLTPQAERRNGSLADALVAWHEWSFVRSGRPPQEWIDED